MEILETDRIIRTESPHADMLQNERCFLEKNSFIVTGELNI